MKNLFFKAIVFFILLSPLFSNAQPCREIVGYYPGWQWYDRAQLVKPTTIDYSKYTIINYAFFKPLANGDIIGGDAWADENLLLGQINWSTNPISYYPNTSIVDLAHNHNVKVLISVGGWTWSDDFPGIAADPVKRTNFAQSCRELIQQYNLDGIDIDWEYPGYAEHNGTPADKQHFTLLMQEIRDTLTVYGNTTGETYLLTSCFGASQANMSNIEWENILPIVDLVNLMSYDFFGTWDATTNHNAPLTAPVQGDPTFNITSAVNTLRTTYNVPANKINIGAAFYGRSTKTVGTPGLHVAQTGTADTQTFSADDGSPMYYNILSTAALFTDHWDATAQVPYKSGNGNLKTFLSYDNPASIAAKAQYAVNEDLRGVIIWEITGDYIETAPGSGIIAGTPLVDTINVIFCGSAPPQNTAPTVALIAPANNTVYNAPATIKFKAVAADTDGTISKVEFYRGNTLLGQDLSAPYAYTWANAGAGIYSITAKAYDNLNAVTTSSAIQVTVNAGNTPPVVSISMPATGAVYFSPATINITAVATDQNGSVSKVRFYQGSTLLGEDLSAPYNWTMNNVPNGNYSLKAKAYDNQNAVTTSAAVSVSVVSPGTNLPPVTQIISPVSGATFTAPATVVVDATASDPNGSITKVRFYDGNTYLGQDLTAPYSWTMSNLPAGNYNLRSRAYDNNGASAYSSTVNITVNEVQQSVCSAPATFYFTPATYIPLSEIQLGQGRLHPVWGVSVDAYIPSNRLNWAISMVHAAHLFRNVSGTDRIPLDFYFATAAKESFCGCDPNIQAAPAGSPYPFTYQPASLGDGCFQIEGNSAYNELIQEYPQRFPVGQHANLIGYQNYETAALCKAYYDIFTVKYWEVHKGWNPIGFFNTATDPNATIRLMAVAYNRGLWYTSLGTVLNTDRQNALASSNLAPYFSDNSYGYDYQNALTSYCLTLSDNADQLDPSQTANNPATGQPYNYFGNFYNPQVTWSEFNAYIDSIAVLYPDVNINNVKAACQATFNNINSGNSISFRYQLGQVINTLMLNLPADDPTTNIATIYGCVEGGNQSENCSTPIGLISSGITNTGLTLSWSSIGATTYNIQYKAVTATSWTTINTNTNTYTFSGLSPCTAYLFRVQAVCANGNSEFSAEQSFSTTGCSSGGPAPNNYCSSYSLNSTAEWIQSVNFGSINNNSGNNNGFGNFMDISTNLTSGTSVPLTLTLGFSATNYTEYVNVWLDFNRDGDYEDTGENIVHQTVDNTTPLVANIPIPNNPSLGGARLRIQIKRGVYGTACDIYSNGEVEDYLVNFVAGGNALLSQASDVNVTMSVLNLFPNPTEREVMAQFESAMSGNFQYIITDLAGKVVAEQAFEVQEGMNIIAIGLDQVGKGAYMVSIRGEQYIGSKILIVVK